MNYEELYTQLTIVEKRMKDAVSTAQKYYKTVVKDTENGDLKDLAKTIAMMEASIESQKAIVQEMAGILDGFDTAEYFQSGDFTTQLLEACRENKIDVYGEAPVFEMFPYKVKIDMDNQDVYLDRKKASCMRPVSFATLVKNGQERLNKEKFKAESFAEELAAAYDLALLKTGKKRGSDVLLTNLYKLMVPMGRSRKEYDQQNFAFDIARLFASDLEIIKDGRRYQFGPSRKNGNAIRILDSNGKEQFLATVSFA